MIHDHIGPRGLEVVIAGEAALLGHEPRDGPRLGDRLAVPLENGQLAEGRRVLERLPLLAFDATVFEVDAGRGHDQAGEFAAGADVEVSEDDFGGHCEVFD